MTKAEYIINTKEAAKMADSKDFKALMETGREECPYFNTTVTDPTSIVRNEGKILGWFECLKFLRIAHVPEVPRPKVEPRGAYEDPHQNPNKKP